MAAAGDDEPALRLRLDRLVPAVAIGSVAMVVAGLVVGVVRVETGQTYSGLTWRFDLSSDSSLQTWFAAMTLALASALLLLLGRMDRATPAGLRWRGLAAIVLFLSIDEVATFHEWTGEALDLDTHGLLFFGWVLFGLAAVAIVAVVFLPFVLRLAPRVRLLLLLAGVAYVGGAIGVEMINASVEENAIHETLGSMLGTAVEESLELTGVLLLIAGLVAELERRGSDVPIVVAVPRARGGD